MSCACRAAPWRRFVQGLAQVHRLDAASTRPPLSHSQRSSLAVQWTGARSLHASRALGQEAEAVAPEPIQSYEPVQESSQVVTDPPVDVKPGSTDAPESEVKKPKKRGRKPKEQAESAPSTLDSEFVQKPKKRGRPKKEPGSEAATRDRKPKEEEKPPTMAEQYATKYASKKEKRKASREMTDGMIQRLLSGESTNVAEIVGDAPQTRMLRRALQKAGHGDYILPKQSPKTFDIAEADLPNPGSSVIAPRAVAPAYRSSVSAPRFNSSAARSSAFAPRASAVAPESSTIDPKPTRTPQEPAGIEHSDDLKPKQPEWAIQKAALKAKFPEGWNPRKRLSPDALAGIRALHAQFPDVYTTEALAARFEVSAEGIRRILKSKWRPDVKEEEDRQQRWFRRGMSVWERQAALGFKPPRRWREEGIVRDPQHHRDAEASAERERAREAEEVKAYREALARRGEEGAL